MNDVKLLGAGDLRRATDRAAHLITVNEVEALQGIIAQAIDALNEVARHGEIASAKRVIARCQEAIDQQKERLKQLQGIGLNERRPDVGTD